MGEQEGTSYEEYLKDYDAARKSKKLSPDTIYFTNDPAKSLGILTSTVKGSDMERAEHFLVEGLISAGLGLPAPRKVSGPLPNLTAQFIINTAKAGYELGKKLPWTITRNNTYVAGKAKGKLNSAFKKAGVRATSITDIFIGGEPTTVKNARTSQLTVQEPTPLKLVLGKLLKDFQEEEVFDLFAAEGELFTLDSESLANFFKGVLEKYEQAFDLGNLSKRFNSDDYKWNNSKNGFEYKDGKKAGQVEQLPDVVQFAGKYAGKRPILAFKAGADIPVKEADLLNYMTGFGAEDSRQRGKEIFNTDPATQEAIKINKELVSGYLKSIEKIIQSKSFRKLLAREFTMGEMKFESGSSAVPKYILYFDDKDSSYKFEILDDKYFDDYVDKYFKFGFRAGKGPAWNKVDDKVRKMVRKRFGTARPETKAVPTGDKLRLNEGLWDSIKSGVKKVASFVKDLFSAEEKEKMLEKATEEIIADELLNVIEQPVTIETDNSVRV